MPPLQMGSKDLLPLNFSTGFLESKLYRLWWDIHTPPCSQWFSLSLFTLDFNAHHMRHRLHPQNSCFSPHCMTSIRLPFPHTGFLQPSWLYGTFTKMGKNLTGTPVCTLPKRGLLQEIPFPILFCWAQYWQNTCPRLPFQPALTTEDLCPSPNCTSTPKLQFPKRLFYPVLAIPFKLPLCF